MVIAVCQPAIAQVMHVSFSTLPWV